MNYKKEKNFILSESKAICKGVYKMSKIIYLCMGLILSQLVLTNNVVGQDYNQITKVPMDINIGAPNIKVFINGKGPYRFDFDTGAGKSLISVKLANDLGLKVIGKAAVGSPTSKKKTHINIVKVPELAISNLKLMELEMGVVDFGDMLKVDGVLSTNDFSDFLVTFNYPEKIVQFEKDSLTRKNKNVIPFRTNMKIAINVNGTKKNAHLDTGFPGSFAFPKSMESALNLKTPLVEMGTARMVGASFKIWSSILNGKIQLANNLFESPEIILEDRSGDFITIGYSAIKNFAVTIDKKNSLLKLEKIIQDKKVSAVKIEDNEFTGRYGEVRSITYENGDLYLQRDGGMKLKLTRIGNNLYKMDLPKGIAAQNKLPHVKFDRRKNNQIKGIILFHSRGWKRRIFC